MAELKTSIRYIELGGERYPAVFDINAIDDIQDRFDKPLSDVLQELGNELTMYKTVKGVLHVLFREAAEILDERGQEHPPVPSEREIGRLINYSGIGEAIDGIMGAVDAETPDGDDDSDSPCRQSE